MCQVQVISAKVTILNLMTIDYVGPLFSFFRYSSYRDTEEPTTINRRDSIRFVKILTVTVSDCDMTYWDSIRFVTLLTGTK
jgi:hypothetical protein